jgi:hypothetical protein
MRLDLKHHLRSAWRSSILPLFVPHDVLVFLIHEESRLTIIYIEFLIIVLWNRWVLPWSTSDDERPDTFRNVTLTQLSLQSYCSWRRTVATWLGHDIGSYNKQAILLAQEDAKDHVGETNCRDSNQLTLPHFLSKLVFCLSCENWLGAG